MIRRVVVLALAATTVYATTFATEAVGERGATSLHDVIRANAHPAQVVALLEAGADVHIRTNLDRTPLHWAARYHENPAVIGILLAAGAALEAPDFEGNTALHWAVRENANSAVVESLVAAGARLGSAGFRREHSLALGGSEKIPVRQ